MEGYSKKSHSFFPVGKNLRVYISPVNLLSIMIQQQKESLGICSELPNNQKVGDHVFTADFGSDDGEKCEFKVKEFEIKKIIESSIAPDGKKTAPYVEMCDIRFPKSVFKSDLKSGFFSSERAAIDAFIESIDFLHSKAHEAYKEKYGD